MLKSIFPTTILQNNMAFTISTIHNSAAVATRASGGDLVGIVVTNCGLPVQLTLPTTLTAWCGDTLYLNTRFQNDNSFAWGIAVARPDDVVQKHNAKFYDDDALYTYLQGIFAKHGLTPGFVRSY